MLINCGFFPWDPVFIDQFPGAVKDGFYFSQQQHWARGVRGASPKFAVVILQIETAVYNCPHFKTKKQKGRQSKSKLKWFLRFL